MRADDEDRVRVVVEDRAVLLLGGLQPLLLLARPLLVGVRDEARMIGGIGPCGKNLCCAAFLTDFEPITVKMAKDQKLALNPAKLSGVCGRLMCCLIYEHESYSRNRGAARCPAAPCAQPPAAAVPEEEKRLLATLVSEFRTRVATHDPTAT